MADQFFSPVGFRLDINFLPNLSDWIQTVDVPSLSIQSTKIPTPFSSINVAGDHLEYDDLSVQFKLDNQLENYSEIVLWMQAIGFPEDRESYNLWLQKNKSITGNAHLTLLDAKYNGIGRYTFYDVTPTYLSGFRMQTDVEGINYISVSTRFSYSKSLFVRM